MFERYPDFPLVTDTETETSVDADISLNNVAGIAEQTVRKRRSLFNLTVEIDPHSAARQSNQFNSVQERVRKEIKSWNELYHTLRTELKSAKKKLPAIDITILPEEKRKFLAEDPDIDHYLRTLHEFQCNALRFLENDFIRMIDNRKNVQEICEQKINVAKENKIRELQEYDGF